MQKFLEELTFLIQVLRAQLSWTLTCQWLPKLIAILTSSLRSLTCWQAWEESSASPSLSLAAVSVATKTSVLTARCSGTSTLWQEWKNQRPTKQNRLLTRWTIALAPTNLMTPAIVMSIAPSSPFAALNASRTTVTVANTNARYTKMEWRAWKKSWISLLSLSNRECPSLLTVLFFLTTSNTLSTSSWDTICTQLSKSLKTIFSLEWSPF